LGRVLLYRIDIRTRSRTEFRNITSAINEAVESSGVKSGTCYVFIPHSTAGVTVNEYADPTVAEDILAQLDIMAPQAYKYRHAEGNASAHIKASLIGNSETFFIDDGKVVLGRWQGIFFFEFDGPRDRGVFVKIVPDPS